MNKCECNLFQSLLETVWSPTEFIGLFTASAGVILKSIRATANHDTNALSTFDAAGNFFYPRYFKDGCEKCRDSFDLPGFDEVKSKPEWLFCDRRLNTVDEYETDLLPLCHKLFAKNSTFLIDKKKYAQLYHYLEGRVIKDMRNKGIKQLGIKKKSGLRKRIRNAKYDTLLRNCFGDRFNTFTGGQRLERSFKVYLQDRKNIICYDRNKPNQILCVLTSQKK